MKNLKSEITIYKNEWKSCSKGHYKGRHGFNEDQFGIYRREF